MLGSCLKLLPIVVIVSLIGSGVLLYGRIAFPALCPPAPVAVLEIPCKQPSPVQPIIQNCSTDIPANQSARVYTMADMLKEVSEAWPASTMERTTMLDRKFELSTQLLRRYITKLHQAYYDQLKVQLQLHWATNKSAPFFPVRRPALKVALLTPHEGQANWMTKMAHYTKEKYAQLHGYPFILDTTPYAANHTRHPTWNRVPAIQKHLPHYDWIFYLDSDIAISNISILLEDFIVRFPPDTYVAFTDGSADFNAGGFFIRNVPWSFQLLEKWWKASNAVDSHQACDSLLPKLTFQFTRCMFRWNDQVALWDVLLPYYKEQSKSDVPVCKTSPAVDWEKSMQCYTQMMNKMGFPYKKRSAFHVYFWPLQTWPRGFTFFYLERRTLAAWTPEELYQPGDFVIHTHVEIVVQQISAYQFLRWLEPHLKDMALHRTP